MKYVENRWMMGFSAVTRQVMYTASLYVNIKYVKQLKTLRKKQSYIFKTHKFDTKANCSQTNCDPK